MKRYMTKNRLCNVISKRETIDKTEFNILLSEFFCNTKLNYKSLKARKYLRKENNMADIQIDSDSFYAKLSKINDTWKQVF